MDRKIREPPPTIGSITPTMRPRTPQEVGRADLHSTLSLQLDHLLWYARRDSCPLPPAKGNTSSTTDATGGVRLNVPRGSSSQVRICPCSLMAIFSGHVRHTHIYPGPESLVPSIGSCLPPYSCWVLQRCSSPPSSQQAQNRPSKRDLLNR